MFSYHPFKPLINGMPGVEAVENQAYNRTLLRGDLEGVARLETRPSTAGERMDYTPFIPWGAHLSTVEVYEDGSKNIFVQDSFNDAIGAILVRPMKPYDAEKEYKVSKEK